MISEEAGISIRLAKNFGSKLLNSNEFEEYIKDIVGLTEKKSTATLIIYRIIKKYYDLNKSTKTDKYLFKHEFKF